VVGLIGGTGLERPPAAGRWAPPEPVATPYGRVELQWGELAGHPAAFWSRHGATHRLPPHAVPYRAGLWALKAAGVNRVVATAAVGSLRPEWPPGQLVGVTDAMDFTRGRPATYFEGPPLPVVHLEAGRLYCPEGLAALGRAARAAGVPWTQGAVLAVTQGPRFETPAEVRALGRLGADLVGMTGFPEVALARELGLSYAAVALVVNPAAGLAEGPIAGPALEGAIARCRGAVAQLLARLDLPGGPCACCPAPAGAPPFPWPVPSGAGSPP
jgi:5'-methylthioadenosine phosphorylase